MMKNIIVTLIFTATLTFNQTTSPNTHTINVNAGAYTNSKTSIGCQNTAAPQYSIIWKNTITYEFNATHIPNQSSTYGSNVRGLWFQNTSGFTMTITEITVPTTASTGSQSIWVGDLGTSAPPSYSSTMRTSTSQMVKTFSGGWWTVPGGGISVPAGNYVGILGYRGTTNSYGAYGGSNITFPHNYSIQINRFISQNNLSNTSFTAATLPVSSNQNNTSTASISRVFFKYTL